MSLRPGPRAGLRLQVEDLLDPQAGWMELGRCYGLPRTESPDFFDGMNSANQLRARAMCALCPVAQTCLEYALRHRIDYGIWGGANERERRQLARQRAQADRDAGG